MLKMKVKMKIKTLKNEYVKCQGGNSPSVTRVTILDCYSDEPSVLGVPPFVSFIPRYAYGAAKTAGADVTYATIDQWRAECKNKMGRGNKKSTDRRSRRPPVEPEFLKADLLVICGGATVPGKYLQTLPASAAEIDSVISSFNNDILLERKWGEGHSLPDAGRGDIDALVFDFVTKGDMRARRRTPDELEKWSNAGSELVKSHPNHGFNLTAEIEVGRGCPRYFTGGCSFCTDPLLGRPSYREPKAIASEISALCKHGVEHFRLSGTSCIFSYKAEGIGKDEHPRPSPENIENLFSSINKSTPQIKTLHTDNANPAVIARYPDESKQILETLVKYCTPGNILSLGLESADPVVAKKNNLNATAKETHQAIRMINRAGAERGDNGLPKLLPGLNFIVGLDGESTETYKLNLDFLQVVMRENLLLRRINIRQVIESRREFRGGINKSHLVKFKRTVRETFDSEFIRLVVPEGTILRNIFLEKRIGAITYGRRAGTYPLLIGFPYPLAPEGRTDALVISHGPRSVGALEYPLNVNTCQMAALVKLPGVGKKRAARIALRRPIKNIEELGDALLDDEVAGGISSKISY